MKDLIINSKEDKVLYRILSAIEEDLNDYNYSFEFKFQLELIIEEIFVNIVKYAYKNQEGIIKITYGILEDPLRIKISFIDDGPIFNPLKAPSPNLSEDIDEREVGSLGIVMIKEYSDELNYKFENNKNIFSVIKNIEE